MSRIGKAIKEGNGLICYLTAGYPSPEMSIEYALACVRGGADVLEIGVPFSDPVADGKVIQFTSQEALALGMTPLKVFEVVERLRERTEVPIVLMGYYNPIFNIGEAAYVDLSKDRGVDGLIVPDLPLEESKSLMDLCRSREVDLVQLVGPTTAEGRMTKIAAQSRGFLYVVSSLGTTGARKELASGVPEVIAQAKRAAGTLPVAVGFGISRPDQVRAVRSMGADAVIVGSSLLERIIEVQDPTKIEGFVRDLVRGSPGPRSHER